MRSSREINDLRPSVGVVLGTRPEAIKLAPVIQSLKADNRLRVSVMSTGQHREMLHQVLDIFDITPDHDIDVMRPNQTLPGLTSRLIQALDETFRVEQPSLVLVQGDTTSAFAGALAAFYNQIPIGHVEAGLRTDDRYAPFPEEINRRLVSSLATWHFAPTSTAREALHREGIAEESIEVTGNTVIDALFHTLSSTRASAILPDLRGHRVMLVTAHRRENFGQAFENLCRAIWRIAADHEDLEVLYPVHLNPNVREPVQRILRGHPRIHLLEPLDYVEFSHLLARSDLVLTDSGGLQEEAPALGKPVLVMRDVTERPEAVEAGVVELVGTDEERIVTAAGRLLDDPRAYALMARAVSPYGDGNAAHRIVRRLCCELLDGAEEAATLKTA